ncbi:Adenylylsulfate kinase-domain-containing protein [Melampsora americana]|nr:Adenylylsulfate kinase-domain-containing protein [Melampsora americana]
MNNLTSHPSAVSQSEREESLGQTGLTIWFTGLSGSGKSTLSIKLEEILIKSKKRAFILDGDKIRNGLNSDLSFTNQDRKENIRRISEVSQLFNQSQMIIIVGFISPFLMDRTLVRQSHLINRLRFIEIYLDSSLEVLEERDVKGLYKKARSGEIKDFTGISSPYEPPVNPEIHIKTDSVSIEDSLDIIMDYLKTQKLI